jgi:hypothetical protein
MDHGVGIFDQAARSGVDAGSWDFGDWNAQIEHGGSGVFGGVDAASDAEGLLGGGDGNVVDPGGFEDVEAGAERGAGEHGEARAAGSAVEIEGERGFEQTNCPEAGRQNEANFGAVTEDVGEAVFGYNGDFEVGTGLFEEVDGGGAEDAVAEGAEADDGDTAAWCEVVQDGRHYSSMVASSISMTGISSRTG